MALLIFRRDNLFPKFPKYSLSIPKRESSLLKASSSCGCKMLSSDLEVNEHWERCCGRAGKYAFVVGVPT